MGLFSSKKKTKVGTSISRLIEDESLPETAKVSVISTVMKHSNKQMVGTNLVFDFANSLALKLRRAYRWAEDNYAYGLPTCHLGSANQGQNIVKAQLDALVGYPVSFVYYFYSPLNSLHAGIIELIAHHGYNPTTNELTNLSASHGFPTFIKKATPVYTQTSHDELTSSNVHQWEVVGSTGLEGYKKPDPYRVDTSATEDYVEVQWFYKNSSGVETTGTFNVSLAAYAEAEEWEDSNYFHVKYTYNDGSPKTGYWLYKDDSGTYPSIDAIHNDAYTPFGSFYPWVHFRDDKVNLATEDKVGTEDYEDSVKFCKYLGLDYQGLTDSIHENPDIGDVEQAMLIFGVAADTTHQAGIRYLFEFFDQLREAIIENDGTSYLDFGNQVSERIDMTEKGIILKDREFSMTLHYATITKKVKQGVVAPVGKYSSLSGTSDIIQDYTLVDGAIPTDVFRTDSHPYYFYRKQISATTYEEIRVYGLALVYHIHPSHGFRASFGADTLLVPLEHNICGQFGLPQRETLYAISAHMVFNTRIVIKTKWYQQGWFKIVLYVAAVVWFFYSGDFTKIMALLAEQGIKAVVMKILIDLAIATAIQFGLNYLAQMTGAEWALAIAAAVAIYVGYKSILTGSLKGAPWAEDLLKLALGLAKGAENEIRSKLEKVTNAWEDFQQFKDQMLAKIETAKDLLDVDTLLDPMEFVALEPFFIIGETPENFFTRTIESGNVGIQTLEAISRYAEDALRLPTLSEMEAQFHVTSI